VDGGAVRPHYHSSYEARDLDDVLARVERAVRTKKALTLPACATDGDVPGRIERLAVEVGVHLSENLTGRIRVNRSAAFADPYATGANPAASATLVDEDVVASRFHVVQIRCPLRKGGGA